MTSQNAVRTVSIIEYGVLPPLPLSDASYDALLRMSEVFTARWTESGRRVYAKNLVGLVAVDKAFIVEVLPKTTSDLHDDLMIGRSRRILAEMIGEWMGVPRSPDGVVEATAVPQTPLIDILITRFLLCVDRLLSGGLRFGYRNTVESRTALRGRIVWAEHLRRERGVGAEIVCEFDHYNSDRPENRLIKWAVHKAGQFAQSPQLKRKSLELSERFYDVPEASAPQADFRRWKRDRNMRRYEAIRPWIKLFIDFAAPGGTVGTDRLPSLVFPMEKLFEHWVANRIARLGVARGWNIVRQSSKFYLSSWGGKSRFQIIPDLILYQPEGPPVVLDTKWKLVDSVEADHNSASKSRSVDQSDMYQMNAYVETIVDDEGRHPADGVLLYPDHSTFPREFLEHPLILGSGRRVWVVAVPLESEQWEYPSEIAQAIIAVTNHRYVSLS